ncbi:plastocyanin [Piscinibacter sp.]|uniref:plastocyanin n=1 Tax=Piscinibacter sp. TaxID=1903157 RepID=UPI002C0F481C|nr:plastocyanin [Albitalea sp.]HUG25050.1 plastocyanin [Albitalea sp.]
MTKHFVLAVSTSLAALAAHAGTLQVTVTGQDGKPAADVVVLVEPAVKVAPKPLAAPIVIGQQNLRFTPFLTIVPVGSTLRFANQDSYDHHVRSTPSGPLGSMPAVKQFEMRLDAASPAPAAPADEYQTSAAPRKKTGTTWSDVKVDKPGPIGLGCHLHSSMRGQIYVSGTAWFAKTDDNGVATFDGVPDGAADVNLWHPDQLSEQTTLRLQVGPAPAKAGGRLNFSPRLKRS